MKPLHAAQARAMLNRIRLELYDCVLRSPQPGATAPLNAVEHAILAISQLYDGPNKAEPRINLATSFRDLRTGTVTDNLDAINTEHANDAFQPTTEWLRQRYPLQPSAHAVAEVRWLQPTNHALRPTLQQKFIYEFGGRYEWRDVPTVEEE